MVVRLNMLNMSALSSARIAFDFGAGVVDRRHLVIRGASSPIPAPAGALHSRAQCDRNHIGRYELLAQSIYVVTRSYANSYECAARGRVYAIGGKMKTRFYLIYSALIVVAVVLVIPSAFAQMGQGMSQGTGHGQGMGPAMGQGMGHYDPSRVITVKGVVQDVQEGTMQRGQKGQPSGMGGMGTHLVIKTDKESLTVLVGPSSFLAQKNFSFAKGDQIEITGSKVKFGGSDAIIAREIKKGDKTLTLRDEKGVPEWSMGKR